MWIAAGVATAVIYVLLVIASAYIRARTLFRSWFGYGYGLKALFVFFLSLSLSHFLPKILIGQCEYCAYVLESIAKLFTWLI